MNFAIKKAPQNCDRAGSRSEQAPITGRPKIELESLESRRLAVYKVPAIAGADHPSKHFAKRDLYPRRFLVRWSAPRVATSCLFSKHRRRVLHQGDGLCGRTAIALRLERQPQDTLGVLPWDDNRRVGLYSRQLSMKKGPFCADRVVLGRARAAIYR